MTLKKTAYNYANNVSASPCEELSALQVVILVQFLH